MEPIELTKQLLGECKTELNVFFYLPTWYAVCKKVYLEKHTLCTPYTFWKSKQCVSWLRNYCIAGTTLLKNTIHYSLLTTILNLQLKQITIQEDPNIHTMAYYTGLLLYSKPWSQVFFILFICFICAKFEETLNTCNVQKPGLFFST